MFNVTIVQSVMNVESTISDMAVVVEITSSGDELRSNACYVYE